MKSNQKSENKHKSIKQLRSLNLTLWRYSCFFVFFIVLLVGVMCYIVVEYLFSSFMQRKVTGVGWEISAALDNMAVTDNMNIPLTELVEELTFEEKVDVAIISARERVVIIPDTLSAREEIYWRMMAEVVSDIFEESDRGPVLFIVEDVYVYAEYAVFGAGMIPSYIVVSYSMEAASTAIGIIQGTMIAVGIVAILIAFLVAYSLAQKVSDPLKSLTATANKMAKGNYDVNFASTEYREIAQLSDTLNYACAEIKKTDAFQKELLANVSHDLRTPLTMIKAYASMVMEISGDNPDKRNQHLQVIIDEADRLAGLVNDVLNMSKISSDMNQMTKKVFNLTEFLYGIIKKFDYLTHTQGYEFCLDIDPDLYTCADEAKIGQVLYNLISNAVNYTGEDKKVYITLKYDLSANRIKFSVRDTGKGISKEDLPSIWNRYYRVKEEHARPVKGTGLGLPIVKTVLEKHSFDFGADSELGKGSVFWVDFPQVSAEIPNMNENGIAAQDNGAEKDKEKEKDKDKDKDKGKGKNKQNGDKNK